MSVGSVSWVHDDSERQMPKGIALRKLPPLPPDIEQRLDVTIPQAMILASLSRPAIMAGIRGGVYRARRLPSGQWVIDKASLLQHRETLYSAPLQLVLPSEKPRGRPRTRPQAEASETPKRLGRKLGRRAQKGPAAPTSSTPQAEGSSP
jgi:hypothetical protein